MGCPFIHSRRGNLLILQGVGRYDQPSAADLAIGLLSKATRLLGRVVERGSRARKGDEVGERERAHRCR